MTYTQVIEAAADATGRIADYLADDVSDLDLTECPNCGGGHIYYSRPTAPGPIGWGATCFECHHQWTWDVPLPGEQPVKDGDTRN